LDNKIDGSRSGLSKVFELCTFQGFVKLAFNVGSKTGYKDATYRYSI